MNQRWKSVSIVGMLGEGVGIVRKNNGINVRNAGVRCAKRFADKIKRSDNYTVS